METLSLLPDYIPKLMKIDDYFFTVNLSVAKGADIEGIFNIFHYVYAEPTLSGEQKVRLVQQEIPYVDLPTGKYEFYLIREKENFIMLCKSEY